MSSQIAHPTHHTSIAKPPSVPRSPPTPCSFLRKCVLSLEFVYLMIMTFAGTWFGIGVFYTILYQLFMALFNSSVLLQNVRGWLGPRWGCGVGAAVQAATGLLACSVRPCRACRCRDSPHSSLPQPNTCRTTAATTAALQIGNILIMIYLFLIIVEVIVNLKNKPEAVEKVGRLRHLYCQVLLLFLPCCSMCTFPAFCAVPCWQHAETYSRAPVMLLPKLTAVPVPTTLRRRTGPPLLRRVLHAVHDCLHGHHHLVSSTGQFLSGARSSQAAHDMPLHRGRGRGCSRLHDRSVVVSFSAAFCSFMSTSGFPLHTPRHPRPKLRPACPLVCPPTGT